MATTTHRQPPPPPPPQKPLDLEVVIVSAKHLKNVNWRTGDLNPYVVFWLDPNFKRSTKPDDSGSTRPVWNERFTLPLSLPLHDSSFSLDVFHSKPSETPKPLVGSLRVPLSDLTDPYEDSRIRTFHLLRPSGRPQGKIRLKLSVKERPWPPPQDYVFAPQHSYYYGPATAPLPPPPPRDYRHAPAPPPPHLPPPSPPGPPPRDYRYAQPPPPPAPAYGSYYDTQSAPPSPFYHPVFFSSAPPLPPRPSFDQTVSGGFYSAPSAPVDYSFEQRQKGGGEVGVGGSGRIGVGTGLAVGAVAGSLGGLALEGIKYEEDKVVERAEKELNSGRSSEYGDYHRVNC